MDGFVVVKKNQGKQDLYVSSRVIAELSDYQHESIMRLIYNHQKSLERFGRLRFEIGTLETKGGLQEVKWVDLNEQQMTLLVTFMRNNEKVIEMKIRLVEEFFRMREALRELQSSDWKETRIKGKLARRNETDVIMTKLIPLAISQGSKNAEKLYMTYSKLVNECVGIPPKSRDKATQRVLDVIFNLENLIENVIAEEVEKGTYYKDIYQICKGKCRLLAELSYLPKQKMLAG